MSRGLVSSLTGPSREFTRGCRGTNLATFPTTPNACRIAGASGSVGPLAHPRPLGIAGGGLVLGRQPHLEGGAAGGARAHGDRRARPGRVARHAAVRMDRGDPDGGARLVSRMPPLPLPRPTPRPSRRHAALPALQRRIRHRLARHPGAGPARRAQAGPSHHAPPLAPRAPQRARAPRGRARDQGHLAPSQGRPPRPARPPPAGRESVTSRDYRRNGTPHPLSAAIRHGALRTSMPRRGSPKHHGWPRIRSARPVEGAGPRLRCLQVATLTSGYLETARLFLAAQTPRASTQRWGVTRDTDREETTARVGGVAAEAAARSVH